MRALILLLGLLAAACAGQAPEPPARPPPTAHAPASPPELPGIPAVPTVPADERGSYKVGKPYQIDGVWYHPREDFGFSETGIASWYGPNFHGKRTANGEPYDMETMTAAHRTLQMPAMVRVTNLENGRSIAVRVNDRGPFARGRIIDMSRRSADLLGFQGRGTARVKVEVMPRESRIIAQLARDGVPPSQQEAALARDTGVAYGIEPALVSRPVRANGIYLQAGAFAYPDNAYRLQKTLGQYATAHVMQADVAGRRFYRVRLGPVNDVDAADELLARVTQAGYPEARIVVE